MNSGAPERSTVPLQLHWSLLIFYIFLPFSFLFENMLTVSFDEEVILMFSMIVIFLGAKTKNRNEIRNIKNTKNVYIKSC